jgi:hypothetical protein
MITSWIYNYFMVVFAYPAKTPVSRDVTFAQQKELMAAA